MINRPTIVLGINTAHDASACLLIDGELKTAIAEERLTRRKHQQGYPHLAVKYVLDQAQLPNLQSVDCIVINEYEQTDIPLYLRQQKYNGKVICNPSHHLLHAYYAWIASGFDDTAILIVDGSGYSYGEYVRRRSPLLGDPPEFNEMEEAESLYLVRDGSIQLIDKRWGLWEASRPFFRFPSLGHMYSAASQYIFGDWVHAGKTMGLAPFGDPNGMREPTISYSGSGDMEIETKWVTELPERSKLPAHEDKICCDVAAKVQYELELAMLKVGQRLYERTQSKNLCISGGVALNSVTNGRILREGPFENLFVTPAANDSGIAIGAALYGHHELTKSVPRWNYADDFHGRSYSQGEILSILQDNPLVTYERFDDCALQAARDIASGNIIGWFEGGSEFGPRALGHRSILCDARGSDMKDQLNATVKFREPFRPYAASVLAEYTKDYFDLDVPSPYMLIVTDVHSDKLNVIPSVCHVDNTCRVQVVPTDFAGKYRKLIEHFMDITGVPLVLDTSFNIRGEPIVESPRDALRCFLGTNIDVLYLENYRVTKITIADYADFKSLRPCLNEELSMGNLMERQDGGWGSETIYVQARTGFKSEIDKSDSEVLRLIDGARSIGEINDLLEPQLNDDELRQRFTSFQRRGFISFLSL